MFPEKKIPPKGFCNTPWLLGEIHSYMKNIYHMGREVFWPKNSIVVSPGNPFDALYLLLDGMIGIYGVHKDDSRYPLWIMCPGNLLGENALLCRRPSVRYIETLEDCRAVAFSPELMFGKIIPQYPEIGLAVMENMAVKAFIISRRELEFNLPLTVRIAMFIYICTFEHESITAPVAFLTVDRIMSTFHIKKNTACLIVNKLVRAGIVRFEDSRIVVQDRARLEGLAFVS